VHTDEEYRYDDGFLISRAVFGVPASQSFGQPMRRMPTTGRFRQALPPSLGVDAAF